MQAVVPAAGDATRLRPMTAGKPKGLVRVAGTPLLTYCFESLSMLPVSSFIVIVGYRGRDIIRYYGHQFDGTPITYVVQRRPRGLADAVLAAEPHVTDDFVVMNGDNLHRTNLRDVLKEHESGESSATVLVESVSRKDAQQTGVCILDSAGHISSVVEKPADPPSNRVVAGFFVFSPLIFDACHLVTLSSRGEYELSAAIDLLCHADRIVTGVPMSGWRININTRTDLENATKRLIKFG